MALPATDFNLCMFLIPERLVSFFSLLLKFVDVYQISTLQFCRCSCNFNVILTVDYISQ